MNHIIRSLACFLTYKRIDERQITPVCIYAEKQDVSYFNLSTNSILIVHLNGKKYYFRECPKLASREDYIRNSIDAFWEVLDSPADVSENFLEENPIALHFSTEVISEFKAYIQSRAADERFLRKMLDADLISEKCCFSIWEKQTYDRIFFERFGMEALPQGTDEIAVYFLWFMRGAAIRFRTLRISHGKEYSFFNAVRAISSKITAEALGLSHMIPDIRWCILQIGDEKEIFGQLSDAAEGIRMKDCVPAPSGSMQRELMNLHVLDVISFQTDHGPNNYTVDEQAGQYFVCAFDNDNPYTFFPLSNVSCSFVGCTPLVGKDGRILRPYFDRELAERICILDTASLQKRLKPYLNFLQRAALESRLKKIKKAIRKTRKTQKDFLLNADEWNFRTAERETKGEYGVTYLTKALRRN